MAVNDLYRDYLLSWFGTEGEDSDVVLSSRVRLARNFESIPFPNRANQKQLAQVQSLMSSVFSDIETVCGQPFDVVGMEGITEVERNILAEKQLITTRMAKTPEYRSAYISEDRTVSILVNEEDHLRIQCMAPGLNVAGTFAAASKIDDVVEEKLNIAFDEKMGYLTSCPTNLGTGLRASVILHLPGLVYTRNMHNITNIAQQLGISVRGLYGEGSETVGNMFAVSNQLTLGFSEKSLIENLTSAVAEIVAHERRARKAFVAYSKTRLEDAVWRAYGILKYARSLGESEVLELISKVRMGVDMELLHGAPSELFSEILIASRPSYIRNLVGNDNLSDGELDRKRAEMVRRILAGG